MILQKINNRSGFTLIELMICIAIIAILLAVLIPMVATVKDMQERNEVEIVDQTEDAPPEQQTPEKEVQEKL